MRRPPAVCTAVVILAACLMAQAPPAVEYYRLVPGFLPENKNENGVAAGTGFASPNPWGAYTAYLMATNAKGQRTWRIENYLPQGNTAQGSTMYLLEGSERALLVDTAQNTPEEMGKNDLKTVLRHLLGHNNDGSVKSKPLDFVVAISHGHGDHSGKNSQMSDRTIYVPDLDWPRNAGPNHVPIKEGGGPSEHGSGTAVGEIPLGDRTLKAITLYGHTPGSLGFLDTENNMILTSDAIGSGLVWAHFGSIARYAESVRHLQAVLKPMDNPAILPGHFYQISMGARGKPPVSGKPLDKQYVDDQLAAAEGVLGGKIAGVPYSAGGRNVMVAKVGSAEMTYNPANLGAASFTGTWTGTVTIPAGVFQVTLALEQNAQEVTGTIATDTDTYPVQKGKSSGNRLAFEVPADQVYVIECVQEGDRITGKVTPAGGGDGKVDVARSK